MKVPSIFKYSRSWKWNYSISRLKNLQTAAFQINLRKHFPHWVNTNNNIFCYVNVMSRFFPFKMSFGIFNHVSSLGICLLFLAFFVLLCYVHIERFNILWDSIFLLQNRLYVFRWGTLYISLFCPSVCPPIHLSIHLFVLLSITTISQEPHIIWS